MAKEGDAVGCLAIPVFIYGIWLAIKMIWWVIKGIFGFFWGILGESIMAFEDLMKIFLTPLCSIGDAIEIFVWLVFWMLVTMGFFALIGFRRK